MADDLIIKFFREDLTEAEEEALGRVLASSVEDALRLGQHAETSYRHYGLPEPRWPGSPPPPGFPRSRGGPKIWFSLVLLAGLLAWVGWKAASKTLGNDKAAVTAMVPTPLANTDNRRASASLPPQGAGSEAPKAPSASAPASSEPAGNGAAPIVTPVNAVDSTLREPQGEAGLTVPAPSQHPHSNLEVVVNQKRPGLVTVRVLNPEGALVVLLYQGNLQPGSWAFDWNGFLPDGSPPPAGTYQIQVQSGTAVLIKKITLKKQP